MTGQKRRPVPLQVGGSGSQSARIIRKGTEAAVAAPAEDAAYLPVNMAVVDGTDLFRTQAYAADRTATPLKPKQLLELRDVDSVVRAKVAISRLLGRHLSLGRTLAVRAVPGGHVAKEARWPNTTTARTALRFLSGSRRLVRNVGLARSPSAPCLRCAHTHAF